MKFSLAVLTGTVLTLGGLPVGLAAQTVPPPNPTREEIDRAPIASVPPSAGQRVTVENGIEAAPCPLAADEFKDINIKIDRVDFGDLKGVDGAMLQPAYGQYLGQTVPIATVCTIRDGAATILRRKGYLAAVQVPPQKIENGTIRFDVLFAKLVGFQVRGNVGKAERIISNYLEAIKQQPIFNVIEAERYLLLARDLPGYDVRLTLRPAGTGPGEVIGDVKVNFTPVQADFNVQNYGSKAVGRIGGITQVRLNGLLGAGDRTTLGFYATSDFKEQIVGQIGEELRLGSNGLTLISSATYAITKPTIGNGNGLTSKTLIGNLALRYPVVRAQSNNVSLSGGVDYIDQRARVGGALITNDKLRVIYAKVDVDAIDSASLSSVIGYSASEPRWRTLGSLELRKGIGALGGSLRCGTLIACPSRAQGNSKAFVARASAIGEFRPIPKLAFTLAPRVQYSRRALLSYEEFSTGNYTVGRGYDPGVLSGDSGFGVSGEIKLGSIVPRSIKSLAIQPYVFGDAAFVWNRDSDLRALNPQRLYSAGGGIRASYGQRISLDVGAAVPLKRAGLQTQRSDVRLLASLSVKFLPWNRR